MIQLGCCAQYGYTLSQGIRTGDLLSVSSSTFMRSLKRDDHLISSVVSNVIYCRGDGSWHRAVSDGWILPLNDVEHSL
jgi:hypothetical protein